MCRGQGYIAVPPVRLEPATLWSRVTLPLSHCAPSLTDESYSILHNRYVYSVELQEAIYVNRNISFGLHLLEFVLNAGIHA